MWPAVLVAGVCFAVPQFLVSNFHGPWLVDVVAAIVSIASLALFLRVWQPKRIWRFPGETDTTAEANTHRDGEEDVKPESACAGSEIRNSKSETLRVWFPW